MTNRLIIKTITLCSLFVFFGFSANAGVFPDTIQGQSSLKVPGWEVFKTATGDLNKDSKNDLVFVMQTTTVDTKENSNLRTLLVYFYKGENQYVKSIEDAKFIMCQRCGGMLGDPLQEIKVDRGSLVVRHYGGSRDRWGYTHRYRFQDGDWCLIGYTRLDADNAELTSKETDVNLLTGDVFVTNMKEDQKDVEEGEIKVTRLPRLSEWDWDHPLSY